MVTCREAEFEVRVCSRSRGRIPTELGVDVEEDTAGDHVRRRGDPGLARVAGNDAQAVHRAVRPSLDLPGHGAARRRPRFRGADRRHELRLSLSGQGAARRDRRRGDDRQRADAPRFRPGGRDRRRAGEPPLAGNRGRRIRLRSRHHSAGGVPRGLPRSREGGRARLYRDARRYADRTRDRVRLHQSGRRRSRERSPAGSRPSSRSPSARSPSATSRRAISGIPEISCSVPT